MKGKDLAAILEVTISLDTHIHPTLLLRPTAQKGSRIDIYGECKEYNGMKYRGMGKCVICNGELVTRMFMEDKITAEEASDFHEQIRWKITSSPHKMRLVCGFKCYDKMRELMKVMKQDSGISKCLRKGCGHKERLHTGIGKACDAVRCKCWKFTNEVPSESEVAPQRMVRDRIAQKEVDSEISKEFHRLKAERGIESFEELKKLYEEIAAKYKEEQCH